MVFACFADPPGVLFCRGLDGGEAENGTDGPYFKMRRPYPRRKIRTAERERKWKNKSDN